MKDAQTETPSVLAGLSPEEIAARLNLKAYQGRQIFQWIHRKRVLDFDEMTDLSKELREELKRGHRATNLKEIDRSVSPRSGTTKLLLDLGDGESVESVLIRERRRITLCISSQVGCAVKCSFCATGLGGYARNLSAGEIVSQVLYLIRDEDLEGRSPNIVYMGMGEPFRNYEETTKSIRLLMDERGLGLGARKIAVSTAGEVPGIERFAGEEWQVRLSLSLHAANDTLRDELVPLNRKYDLKRLLQAMEAYQSRTGRQVTIEWALMAEVNDSLEDAKQLADWAKGLDAHVNLIPYNPVRGLHYRAPAARTCKRFCEALLDLGLGVTLRAERGQDIDAACGQLRRARPTADRQT